MAPRAPIAIVLALTTAGALACGALGCSAGPAPKPLPGGPPPEYEAPRAFDLGGPRPGGTAAPATKTAAAPAASAPAAPLAPPAPATAAPLAPAH